MNFLQNRILFRADGNSTVGLGHIMRCLALSEMLKSNFKCVFVTKTESTELSNIITKYVEIITLLSNDENGQIAELEKLVKSTDLVVLDGYEFSQKYIQFLKRRSKGLVLIDDFGQGSFDCALVINHASKEISNSYNLLNETKLLCGFDFLLLRKEFLHFAKAQRVISKVETAFVCMGGADPSNTTIKVLEACIASGLFRTINLVIGAVYSNLEQLAILIAKNNEKVVVNSFSNINASELINLVMQSQIAICPASTIALEVCCVKTGILSGITADNQNLIHSQLLNSGCASSIGDFNVVTKEMIIKELVDLADVVKINKMMQNQSNEINGESDRRLLEAFTDLASC